MHFSLVKLNPPESQPSHGFDDVILPLFHALSRLGYKAEILFNRVNPKSRNIVFGSCISPARAGRMLPPGSIIFNLEQISPDSKWCNAQYLAQLRAFSVWDYSGANIDALRRHGVRDLTHVPLAYVPEMTRLKPEYPQDVDALFYGLITERRDVAIRALHGAGVHILASQDAFGDLRDKLLAHSRLVLNIHHFVPARLEIVRLGYVWANKKAVVSERGADTEVPAHLEEACLCTLLMKSLARLCRGFWPTKDAWKKQPLRVLPPSLPCAWKIVWKRLSDAEIFLRVRLWHGVQRAEGKKI
ncbi:MAG: hypothetical protein LBN33_03350 [Desulfovibrio sp.]|jgi:hypothetical protein|nr:hypothetical protein [Desulfovibrio sp.]